MKKIISILLAAVLLTGTVFAEKKYSGDIQIIGGLSTDAYQIKKESWHLFKINSVLDAGFIAGINAGIGGTTLFKTNSISIPKDSLGISCHINAITGPAIALSVKNIVRFNIAAAFNLSFLNLISRTESDKTVYTYCAPLGFALEAQAKFTPDKKISPIVGYRLTTNFENNFSTFSDGTNKSFPVDSLEIVTNTIFTGILCTIFTKEPTAFSGGNKLALAPELL